MKKLISICFLLFFVAIGNAQVNKKSKWSELNQDQLNLALTHSTKTAKTGKILTLSGLCVATIGIVMALPFSLGNDDGIIVFGAGIISTSIGIPVWIVGGAKKKNITLELAKFNPKGSASINGVGLKIDF